MPRLHALELLADEAGQDAVRRSWQALRDAGLASQLDHPSPTNAPHVTLVAAPDLPPAIEELAVRLVRPLLPITVRASGLAVLGGKKVTLVRLLDVPEGLTRAVLELRGEVAEDRHPGWLPHVTLARRLPRADVQRAVDVLGHADAELNLTALRRWDPERREVRSLLL
ncbi:2'-5' RNA ligase family protein [Nocardioides cynanchi]|uniref:2'-5' RNA ligase family protein n=1 Tax=Nocardioides cynanchi TaxID=2558918 RepID=UPI001243AB3C|nr:2'-5' RNA ligase family protein [Nocardioides cynanchi]